MAYINRIPKTSTSSDQRKLRNRLYQDTQYRKIRDWYYQTHPLCEECLKNGKTVPADDVHHKISPFKGSITMQERYHLLRDEMNFKSLCRDCHEKEHGNVKKIVIFGKNSDQ